MSDNREPSESSYFRPTLPFQCGNCDAPCRLGPTPGGTCRAGAECQPLHSESRWICARPESIGGPCADGPLPDGSCCRTVESCVPVAAIQRRRRNWVVGWVTVGVGLLLIALGGPWQASILAPGPLCEQHAQLLGDVSGMQRCQACHEVPDADGWAAALFGNHDVGRIQSSKCLTCHESQLGHQARLAHSIDHSELPGIGEPRPVNWLGGHRTEQLLSSELACSLCHREHQGSEADLARITDQQCQACHRQQFAGFEIDHPQFDTWPQQRSISLRFDHQSHSQKHFVEKGRGFDCRTCHVGDEYQNVQQLKSFEQACGDCHQESIRATGLGGLTLLRLPRVNLQAVEDTNQLGLWPHDATDFFDGVLPPWMMLLVAADPDAAVAFDQLQGETDWSLLDEGDPKQVQAAVVIGRECKRVLWELSQQDQATLRKRLATTTGLPIQSPAIDQVVRCLPYELLREAQQLWLPDLEFEIQAWDEHETTGQGDSQVAFSNSSVFAPNLNPQEKDGLRQQATLKRDIARVLAQVSFALPSQETLAPNPLRDMRSDTNTGNPASGSSTEPLELKEDPSDAEMLPGDSETSESRTDATNQPRGVPAASGGTLLIENPLKSLRTVQAQETVAQENANPTEPQGNDETAVAHSESSEIGSLPIVEEPLADDPAGEPLLLEPATPQPTWRYLAAYRQGWTRDDRQFSVTYYPVEHADPLLIALYELGQAMRSRASLPLDDRSGPGKFAIVPASRFVSEANPTHMAVRTEFLSVLSGPTAIGDCSRCHQLEASPLGLAQDLKSRWTIDYRNPARGSFTQFSHQPHLVIDSEQDCQSCHQLATRQGPSSDPHALHHGSDFVAMRVEQCASCHRRGAAATRCTLCHDYHVGRHSLQ